MMKVLFIGGTGNISTAVSRACLAQDIELFILNRGLRQVDLVGAKSIVGDINSAQTQTELARHQWDVVVNWIAFDQQDIERDIKLFSNKTGQYIFISSASCYQKPASSPFITESTPLHNPFWQYSRDKIAAEDALLKAYRENAFPICIVRPSLTYDTVIPLPFGGWTEFNVIQRLKQGKPIIVQGDGTSLFTITHASDFAKGFVGLLGHPQTIGHAFHITSDESLSWDQINRAVADAVGVTADLLHIPSDFIARIDPDYSGTLLGDKSHSVIFDNSKIKQFVPDFCATIPFAKGIRKTIDWFNQQPDRQVVNPHTEARIERIIQAYQKGC
ncbi:NAD-dependent epimerase/dehydratase family protein [Neptunicella sp. SCSIO 80796]|uniref:NAD-dependent epimerase/dehydratase family protein n=1 Tax=Neptunicella plasticusilytica TaxID=3117012 RepID=UPI003A4E257B